MSNYLIKLYPIDRYYFGGEATFGMYKNENCFVRSNYFPQQTTLVGMLRYYLLNQNQLLNERGRVLNKRKADILIGPLGFNAQSHTEINFGILKKLSPVFITGPDGEYFVQSREYGFQLQEDEVSGEIKKELIPLKLNKHKGKVNKSEHAIHYFEGFNSKTEIPNLLVNVRTGQMRHFEFTDELKNDSMNGVFIPDEQVGIRIPKNKQERNNNEDGFYKQIGYRMLPGFGFAFYAEVDKGTEDNFDSGLVRMGADQTWFQIEIKPTIDTDQSILNNFSKHNSSLVNNIFLDINDFKKKVVLLSDCYIEKSIYDMCPFASASTIPFRYLEVTTETENDSSDKKKKTFKLRGAGLDLTKSEKFRNLIKKGSVLYVNSELEKLKIIEDLKLNKAFYQIGYNYAI